MCVCVDMECEFVSAEDAETLDMVCDVPFTSNWVITVIYTHPLLVCTARLLSLRLNSSAPHASGALHRPAGEPAVTCETE